MGQPRGIDPMTHRTMSRCFSMKLCLAPCSTRYAVNLFLCICFVCVYQVVGWFVAVVIYIFLFFGGGRFSVFCVSVLYVFCMYI